MFDLLERGTFLSGDIQLNGISEGGKPIAL